MSVHPTSQASHPLPARSVNPPRLPRDRDDQLLGHAGGDLFPSSWSLSATSSCSAAQKQPQLSAWHVLPVPFASQRGGRRSAPAERLVFLQELSPLQLQANELTNEFSVGHGSALQVIKGYAAGQIKLQVTTTRVQARQFTLVCAACARLYNGIIDYLLRTTTLLFT